MKEKPSARILLMNERIYESDPRSSFAYLYISLYLAGTKGGCVLRRMTKVLRSWSWIVLCKLVYSI